MPLTLHHMGLSQSERIIWLAEELGIDYKFVKHNRDPVFAPQSIKDLHPSGSAPVMVDDPSPVTNSKVVIAESGAIVDYIIAVYGGGRLALTPKDGAEYPHYIEWFHVANGSLMPAVGRMMITRSTGADPDSPLVKRMVDKWNSGLETLDARLAETGAYLAGKELTAADIMNFFALTTMRGFFPVEFDTEKHKNILAYLQRVGERPAYQKAMKLCEGDDFVPLLQAKATQFDLMKNISPK
ncbi:hypothetical protein N7468_004741 [Penicillium chermesinum]|uniref:Glutathione S-transferase n=1 Tax=Penicillium chermesinum TaxID=63820 RepID=A0A9W9P964_9EURO|nr:uncharacterized protein N7468_004741 [Penicillium chermesinum]KAJ5240122.1 hypothetical protein N7468_004741 [Penicillium chermesinum]KAJ6166999.1 hypothetical protein N7470_002446 [Penicillium chermesinum]